MEIREHSVNGVVVLGLRGKVTSSGGHLELRDRIVDLSRKGTHRVVLNLEGVSAIDAAGLSMMLNALATVRRAGGTLALANLTLSELLVVTKLLNEFEVFELEDDALASVQVAAAA